MRFKVINQPFQERVSARRRRVADKRHVAAGTCHSHIHPPDYGTGISKCIKQFRATELLSETATRASVALL